MNNNYLKHYGVPGMKWGVRKDRTSGAKGSSQNKESSSEITDEDRNNYFSMIKNCGEKVTKLGKTREAMENEFTKLMSDIRESEAVRKAAEQHYPAFVEWKKLNIDDPYEDDTDYKKWNDDLDKRTYDILRKPLESLNLDYPIDQYYEAGVWPVFGNTRLAISDVAKAKYKRELQHSEETTDMEQNELKHWGILGMKWGVRKSKKQLAKEADAKKAENEGEDFKTSRKKSISKMSDDELNTELKRRKLELEVQKQKDAELQQQVTHLKLEAEYATLNPPKVSLGKKIWDGIWPTIEKNALEAGGTLMKEGLVDKGRDLLGLKDTKVNWNEETQRLKYLQTRHNLSNQGIDVTRRTV